MWRSSSAAIARRASSLYKLTTRGGPNVQSKSQVLHLHSKTPTSSVLDNFSSKIIHFHQTHRFYSQFSSDPFGLEAERPQIGPLVPRSSSESDVIGDAHNVFDEMRSSNSWDSEGGSFTGSESVIDFGDAHTVFDEMPSSNFLDSEGRPITGSQSSVFDGIDLAENESESSVESEVQIQEVDLEKLENVLSLLQSRNIDVSLESGLESMDVCLHEEFVLRVVETPLVPGENLIGLLKWGLKRGDISLTTRLVESLVQAISSESRMTTAYALWDLLKELRKKENGVLTTEILNDLLSLLSKLGKGKAGFEVYNSFRESGCVPNEDTYYFTMEALFKGSLFQWAGSVCENMVNEGKLPSSEKVYKIISYMCRGHKAKDAHAVYLSAKKKDMHPPPSLFNNLISLLCREDATVHLALEMLEDISKEERKYAIKPFSSVIQGLCRIKDIEKAKVLLFNMIEAGPPPGNGVFNSIINSLSKAGELGEAMKIVEVMESRGLRPDVYTYSVIMSGYVKGGEMEEACNVLAEAKKRHTKLTPVTYHTLIRGYCKLENFDKALELLSEMKEHGVTPNADEYNKLIQSLCLKSLDWETAEKLRKEMEGNGLHLNGITKGLIKAVKELEEAKFTTKEKVTTEEVAIEA